MKVFRIISVFVAYYLIALLETYWYIEFKSDFVGVFCFFTLIEFALTFFYVLTKS